MDLFEDKVGNLVDVFVIPGFYSSNLVKAFFSISTLFVADAKGFVPGGFGMFDVFDGTFLTELGFIILFLNLRTVL